MPPAPSCRTGQIRDAPDSEKPARSDPGLFAFGAAFSGLAEGHFRTLPKASKKGGKPGKKHPLSGSFSLPFGALFGMVFHLSLGVHTDSPKHKPNIEKTGVFGPAPAPESRSANRAVEE
jgi:hypothetical protein